MDLTPIFVGAGIGLLPILLILRRSIVRIRPGELGQVTLLGVPRAPLGPGIHFVNVNAIVRKVSSREAGSMTPQLLGQSGTITRKPNIFVPTGSANIGGRETPAISPWPLEVGDAVIVVSLPRRFIMPEFEPIPPRSPGAEPLRGV